MGKVLKVAVIVIASLAAILVALVFLVPMDTYRGPIESAARNATGRDLKINGGLALSLYPTIGIKAESVTFTNAEGGRGDFMATMESLVVGLELIPLLGGDLRVSELVLTNPVIHLEVNKSGSPNWKFSGGESTPAADGGEGASLKNLSFGDVRISGGSLTYDNFQTGEHETLSNVDLDIALADLDSPLSLDGALDYKSRRIELDITAEKPRAFIDGGQTPMTVKIDAGDLDASIAGTYNMTSGAMSGALDMRASSVRGLMNWLGNAMPGEGGFGELRLKGDLSASGSTIAIKNASLSFDGMNGTGSVTVNTGGKVPSISGQLALDRLDINPYLGGGSGGGGHATSGRAPAGWSDAPISLSGLRSIGADLKFSTNSVSFQNIKTGKAVLALTIKGGVLTANLSELALYEGSGKASLTADGSGATPAIKIAFDFSGIKAMPLLTDAMDMKFLEGTGAFKLSVSGAGKSERAIMSSLSGSGSMNFHDGAIKGIDLGLIANTIASALSGSAVGGSAETEFTKLAATYTIRNGVLSNEDLQLTGPHISMTGKGVIDLGRQTMKYRVEPKAIGTAQAGGQAPAIGIPFVIQGPWSKLSYMPDLENVIGGSINSLLSGKGLQGGIPGLDQIIPGLTGGGGQGQGAGSLIPGLPAIPGITPQNQQPAPENNAVQPPPANDADVAPANDADQQAPAPANDADEAPAAETPANDADSAPEDQPADEPAPEPETTETPPAEGG